MCLEREDEEMQSGENPEAATSAFDLTKRDAMLGGGGVWFGAVAEGRRSMGS